VSFIRTKKAVFRTAGIIEKQDNGRSIEENYRNVQFGCRMDMTVKKNGADLVMTSPPNRRKE